MRYVGIDPGSRTSPTAIAVLEDKKIINVHTIQVPEGRTQGGELLYFMNTLATLLELEQPGFIYCEEPFLQGLANKRMCKFLGSIEMAVEKYCAGIQVNFMAPTEVRKLVEAGSNSSARRALNAEMFIIKKKYKKGVRKSPEDQAYMRELNKRGEQLTEDYKAMLAKALIGKVTNNRLVIQYTEAMEWDKTDAIAITIAGRIKYGN